MEKNDIYDVIIEIPKGSRVKYEFDTVERRLRVDRVLNSAYVYPYNYGYIPNTLSEDGDPVDVLVLGEHIFFPGCVISCRVIGGLETFDGKKNDMSLKSDPKIIMVPIDGIDTTLATLAEVPEVAKQIISDFFRNYKNNEPNKKVMVGKWLSKQKSIENIMYV